MHASEERSRHWGWEDWIDEWWTPPPATGEDDPSPHLWILEGRPDGGGRDLLGALAARAQSRDKGDPLAAGAIHWLERATSESDWQWQIRAEQSWEAAARGGELVLLPSGDELSPAWWHRQLGRWFEEGAGGRLVVLAESRAQAIAAIARRVGGPEGRSVRCPVPRWSAEKIDQWRKTFAAPLGQSTEALLAASEGGWPGLLWNLLEEKSVAENPGSGEVPWLKTLLSMDRVSTPWLLAAAEAPAAHRDWIEILTGSAVPPARWQETRTRWLEAGWLTTGHDWVPAVREAFLEAATRWPAAPRPTHLDRREAVWRMHALLPQEGSRRLLRPLARLLHFDLALLGELFGEDGREMAALLAALPEVRAGGPGPWRLEAAFARDWHLYDQWMPSAADDEWIPRARAAWARRKGALLQTRAEAEDAFAQETARLEGLRRSLPAGASAVGARTPASLPVSTPPRGPRGRGWLAHGLVFLGMAWLYLEAREMASVSPWSFLGPIACLFVGGVLVMRAEGSRSSAVPAAPPGPVVTAATQAALQMARDRHTRQVAQVASARARLRQVEALLEKPYCAEPVDALRPEFSGSDLP